MYSNDIQKVLESANYRINSETYLGFIHDSPQINHIRYSPYGSYYEIWTLDDYYWKFSVYTKGD